MRSRSPRRYCVTAERVRRTAPVSALDLLADQPGELVEVVQPHRGGGRPGQLEGPSDPGPQPDLEIDLEPQSLARRISIAPGGGLIGPGRLDQRMAGEVRGDEPESVPIGLGFGQRPGHRDPPR